MRKHMNHKTKYKN